MRNLIEELSLRGLIYQKTPEVERAFKNKTTCYLGIDPSGESLHVGHLLGLLTLKRISSFGHRIIILLGGGTALIGDPAGKEAERPVLPERIIKKNKEKIKRQLKKIFNFDNKNFILTDNAEWLKKLNLISFLRDIGKLITLNSMLDLEFVKRRIETQKGISFAEFTYQLLQAYDFLNLFQKYKCEVQIGGADQLGNIVQGIELIRKKLNKKAYGLVYPLLIDPQTGKKFGKTEEGENIWLDPKKTSVFDFYQFFLNIDDKLIPQIIRYFSFKSLEEIENLENRWLKEKESRILQKELALELVELLFGKKEKMNILKLTKLLFETEPKNLTFNDLKFMKRFLPYKKDNYDLEKNLIDLKLAKSKSEARELIKQTGVKTFFILNKFYLLRRGKKKFGLIEIK